MNIITLSYHLWLDCPHCNETMDLADQDDDYIFSTPIFNNTWHHLKGEVANCPNCSKEIIIDGVEY